MPTPSNKKISASWIGFIFVAVSVSMLYGLGKIDEYVSLLKNIVTAAPAVIFIFTAIVWASKSDGGKTAKVIGGVVSGVVVSAVIYYFYLDEIMEWINDKQETITAAAFIVILFFSFLLAIAANRQKAIK